MSGGIEKRNRDIYQKNLRRKQDRISSRDASFKRITRGKTYWDTEMHRKRKIRHN